MTEFRSPATVSQALADLGAEGALALGGGTALMILVKSGLLEPDRVVWLGRIPELRQITVRGDGALVIGAGVRLADLWRSPEVVSRYAVLAEAASQVGNPRVQAVATLGGHLAHADPRQDLAPVLLVLGASVLAAGPAGTRSLPLAGFYTGFMSTALQAGEILTGVIVPPPPPGRRAAYFRFTPGSASDYPTVGVATSLVVRGGQVVEAEVALGAGAAWPRLVPGAGEAIVGVPDHDALATAAGAVAAAADPSNDQRGSAAYKRAMARLWTQRLLSRLLGGTTPRSRLRGDPGGDER